MALTAWQDFRAMERLVQRLARGKPPKGMPPAQAQLFAWNAAKVGQDLLGKAIDLKWSDRSVLRVRRLTRDAVLLHARLRATAALRRRSRRLVSKS
jgi:hypothetical protein